MKLPCLVHRKPLGSTPMSKVARALLNPSRERNLDDEKIVRAVFTSDTETNPSHRAERDQLMARSRTRRSRGMTDNELLASAWGELKGTGRIETRRMPFPTRTAPFSARHRTLCERCGRWIERGDDVRFHSDFSGAVHGGCKPPPITLAAVAKPSIRASDQSPPSVSSATCCTQGSAGDGQHDRAPRGGCSVVRTLGFVERT